MLKLLWLVPAIPFAGALVLAVVGARMSHKRVTVVGVGTVAASAFISVLIAAVFLSAPPASGMYTQTLWTWIDVGSFHPQIAFYLDALSLVMILVVTFVSFLIHLYSAEFMRSDEGYSRFFAYMNLFVACMVTLLLADNLLLLYLGWEGVGLCSYLLIGFWYQDPVNGRAGRKAFIVTRVGDTAMAIGLFLLFHSLGTLRIQDLLHAAEGQWSTGSAYAIAATALLLGGAVGKSAQLPLQTWLPDAMAGPTPTSALIHAATMVTAGVYLIARTHVLFELAPPVQFAVAAIGAATLLMAGFSALVQNDIKRVLAYSILIPMIAGVLAWAVARWSASATRWIALIAVVIDFFLALSLWIANFHAGLRTWFEQADWAWIPQFGIRFHLALDGLSLLLLMLTFFLGILSVLASWNEIAKAVGFFHLNLLWILAGIAGVFLAVNLFLFYFAWELMLVPMYFLISIWGHENRVYAAVKFFLFTQLSGLLMLIAILALFFLHYHATGVYTFEYEELLGTAISPSTEMWIMLGFFVSFAVKLPVVVLHTWLPDAHTEAPTAGSVILAGLLLKTGAYGMLRFVVPLFPHAAHTFAPVAMALGVAGILYGAILAFGQTDLKRVVAYTSVSHLGFVLLGIFAWNDLALQGPPACEPGDQLRRELPTQLPTHGRIFGT